MTQTEAAWLAGFLDGEGSFMILRSRRSGFDSWEAAVAASSTTDALLVRCRELAGGKITRGIEPGGLARRAGIWTLKGKAVGPTVEAVLPFLVSKREQAAIVLALRLETKAGASPGKPCATDPEKNARRDRMRLAVQALNHRGTAPVPAERLAALKWWRDRLAIADLVKPQQALSRDPL